MREVDGMADDSLVDVTVPLGTWGCPAAEPLILPQGIWGVTTSVVNDVVYDCPVEVTLLLGTRWCPIDELVILSKWIWGAPSWMVDDVANDCPVDFTVLLGWCTLHTCQSMWWQKNQQTSINFEHNIHLSGLYFLLSTKRLLENLLSCPLMKGIVVIVTWYIRQVS